MPGVELHKSIRISFLYVSLLSAYLTGMCASNSISIEQSKLTKNVKFCWNFERSPVHVGSLRYKYAMYDHKTICLFVQIFLVVPLTDFRIIVVLVEFLSA